MKRKIEKHKEEDIEEEEARVKEEEEDGQGNWLDDSSLDE